MTSVPRRELNRIEKEKRILEAALSVFSRMGYSGTTMDAVAAEAGLSKPTLYQYFESKELLFTAMMKGKRDDMLLAFETPEPDKMVEQLLSFSRRYADTVMRPELLSLARLIIGEAQRFPEIGKAYQASGPNRVLEGMIAYLEAQRKAGRLTFYDAEMAAQDLWGLILSAPRTQALYEPDNQPNCETLAKYIHNGLRVFLCGYSTNITDDLETLKSQISSENTTGDR